MEKLEKIDYQEITIKIWDIMEENSIPIQLQISQQLGGFDRILFKILEPHHLLQNNKFNYVDIKNESIISLICDALIEFNLTNFDFYSEFINYYYLKQIEKQKNLGKSLNIDRFLHDIQKYSIKLANAMSNKQLTQVQYKQQGILYNEEGEEEKWLDEFFYDDGQNGSYKKDIRSCSLVQKKGPNFSFVHKSIQEFLIAADLYELLVQGKDLDLKVFDSLMEEFLRESKYQFQFLKSQQLVDKIKLIKNLIEKIQKHAFNFINYSTEIYSETRKYLIQKISDEIKIIQLLKFLVHLTTIDQKFIQSGNTSIFGANLAKCNLSESKFENININGINLNGAKLFNCEWKNLRINEQLQMNGHSQVVKTICFSPDGTTLASGSNDQSIRLWDAKTGQQKAKLEGHSNNINSVCFSPDGSTLVSGSADYSIRFWDVRTGQQKAQLDTNYNNVSQLYFSPDGATLAQCGNRNHVLLLDVGTGNKKAYLFGHSGFVHSVCFSPDGTTLASGSQDKSIRLWDVKTEQQKAKLDGHTLAVYSVCFSPDGTILASGGMDKSINYGMLRLDNKKLSLMVIVILLYQYTSRLMPKEIFQLLVVLMGLFCYGILRLDNKMPHQTVILVQSKQYVTHQMVLFQLPEVLISLYVYGMLKLDNKRLNQMAIRIMLSQYAFHQMELHQLQVVVIALPTGQQKAKIDCFQKGVSSVKFSPDGNTLALSSFDKTIRLIDVQNGQQKAQLEGHKMGFYSVCFSPDGTTLASVGYGESICFWDVRTGQQYAQLGSQSDFIRQICFSPDGTTLASSSDDMSICLWDAKTGQLKAQLNGHDRQVFSVCFSPDGTMLASGGMDNSIRLWDVKTGQQQAQIDGHTSEVYSVCFSPDGTALASSSGDKSIRVWDIQVGLKIQPFELYKDLLSQFQITLNQNQTFEKNTSNLNMLLISQQTFFQVNGALIFQGQFKNHKGIDLRQLLLSKGGIFLENKLEQQKQN
ncbi:unnamed protein product [Paramecium sonneborni]|uniref:WD-40 repeat protein n=1 Tax=Paramecium sonneborni TaxID=65129 RepID=A0A8S1PP08_9CILI|nr:unnamed protein product [Paramecium sonneborni]